MHKTAGEREGKGGRDEEGEIDRGRVRAYARAHARVRKRVKTRVSRRAGKENREGNSSSV